MRLLRFDYTIFHVPGKHLVTASKKQKEEFDLYVESVLLQLPASDKRLEEISARQKDDLVCKKLQELL